MTARDAGFQIAQGAAQRADDVHIDAEPLAEHAARVADPPVAVDGVTDGDGVDQFPFLGQAARQHRRIENAAQVGVADFVPGDGNFVGDEARQRFAARKIDHHLADVFAGHLFGRLDGGPDRGLGIVQIDDGARAQSPGHLVADADDFQPIVLVRPAS